MSSFGTKMVGVLRDSIPVVGPHVSRAQLQSPPHHPAESPPGTPHSALSRLAWAHAHETLIWASKGRGHTFNYHLINAANPSSQISSVWRIPSIAHTEKTHGYHPTQKPLGLVRRALLASSREGELVFDPFCGSGTTGVAAKELGRSFVGAELEEEFCGLAARRIRAALRRGMLRE